jgi:hypothetical protein
MRCIYCGEEIEGSVKEHQEQKHFGTKKPAAATHTEPSVKHLQEPQIEKTQLTEKTQKEIPKLLNSKKPKRRYLSGVEIITLLQNTNKQFNYNEVQGCPLTKETE